MSLTHLLMLAFAAFSAWHSTLTLLPRTLPVQAHPVLLAGLITAFTHVPDRWVEILAALGAAILIVHAGKVAIPSAAVYRRTAKTLDPAAANKDLPNQLPDRRNPKVPPLP